MFSKKLISLSTAVTLSLLVGCVSTPTEEQVKYLAVNMPKGPIHTTVAGTMKEDKITRISPGFYRPPPKFDGLVGLVAADTKSNNEVLRNVEVKLKTPFCLFPIVCVGIDVIKKDVPVK